MDITRGLAALSIGAALQHEEARLEQGVARVATGWPRLDAALGSGLAVPSLTVLGAPPKSGKSTWTQMIAVRHVEAGGVAYVLDLENGRRRVLRQILCRCAELGPKEVAAALRDERAQVFRSREAAERWGAAKVWLRDTLGPRLYVETTPPHDLVARVAAARQVAGDAKLLLVIDSLQRLPAANPRDDRRTTVDAWIALLGRLRHEHEAAILLVSEIRRGREGYAPREDAYKESSGIEYGADLALTLSRAAADDEGADAVSTLRVELARDSDEDPRGDVASYRPVHPYYGLAEENPAPRRGRGRPATQGSAAAEWLRDQLAHGAMRVSEILRRGEEAGYSRRTLYRARDAIGAVSCTVQLHDGWRLP